MLFLFQRFETPPFNVQENVFVPGQCEDDQQSSNPLVTMVDTQLRPMTDPVTVNIDRIAELEKQMHDGEVEKKLLKEMTDEKHREKVQLLEEQLKLLEAESIEKKLQLEHTLNEVRKKLERPEDNNNHMQYYITFVSQFFPFQSLSSVKIK